MAAAREMKVIQIEQDNERQTDGWKDRDLEASERDREIKEISATCSAGPQGMLAAMLTVHNSTMIFLVVGYFLPFLYKVLWCRHLPQLVYV